MVASKKKMATRKTGTGMATTQFEDDAGSGFEDTTPDDFAIPFLIVLQKLSPVCDEDSPKYTKGARQGQVMNSVTEKRWEAKLEENDSVEVVPCAYVRQFIAWGKREDGGGFKGVFDVTEGEKLLLTCVRDDKNRDITPDGIQLVDTRQWYVLMYDPETEEWDPIILALSSTQVKNSKKWMTQMKNLKLEGANGKFTPPMFSHIYPLSTIQESNDQGSWRGVSIGQPTLLNGKQTDVYQKAKEFRDMVIGGDVKAAYESTEDSM